MLKHPRPPFTSPAMLILVRRACICVLLLLAASFAYAQETTGVTGSICGLVSDETGVPASHVHVIAFKQDRRGHSGGFPTSFTDETGHYCIGHLTLGKYVMSVFDEKKGYPHLPLGSQFYAKDYVAPQATLSAENPEARVDWKIPFKAGFLRLHVSISHLGVETVPITFDLVVRSRPKFGIDSVMTSLKTDPRSSITILLPPNEDVLLTATVPGYKRWPDQQKGKLLNLSPGKTEDVTIHLVPINY